MRKYLLALACSAGLIAAPAAAWANQTPSTPTVNPTTGQHGSNLGPSHSCGAPGTSTPGNSGSANNTGSPFNANNTKLYAGNANSGSLHANSTAAVSQYDVACF